MFDFVAQLSCTVSLSLSELSSAAQFYLDCGNTLCFVIFSLFCLRLFTMAIISVMLLQF